MDGIKKGSEPESGRTGVRRSHDNQNASKSCKLLRLNRSWGSTKGARAVYHSLDSLKRCCFFLSSLIENNNSAFFSPKLCDTSVCTRKLTMFAVFQKQGLNTLTSTADVTKKDEPAGDTREINKRNIFYTHVTHFINRIVKNPIVHADVQDIKTHGCYLGQFLW